MVSNLTKPDIAESGGIVLYCYPHNYYSQKVRTIKENVSYWGNFDKVHVGKNYRVESYDRFVRLSEAAYLQIIFTTTESYYSHDRRNFLMSFFIVLRYITGIDLIYF